MSIATDEMMSVTEAADVIQIPRHAINQLIEIGWFTAVRNNRASKTSKRLLFVDEVAEAKRLLEGALSNDRQLAAMKTYRRKMKRL